MKHQEMREATSRAIMDAFWSLYRDLPIEKITVKAICEKAGCNRSTFYEYYTDSYSVLEAIEEGYRALSNKARGIVIADVTTAGEMAAAQQESLREKLASVTGKKVQLRMHTDESLIGGVVVKIGDKRIDGSVQGRLAALSKELMANK